MTRWGVRLTVAAALLVLLAGCDSRRGWPMGTGAAAPDLPLAGAPGRTISLARSEGRVSLVAFGYTSCPDICPTTLTGWKRVKKKLGHNADRVRFVFVSIDYRNDTPAMAAAFARRFDPSFLGVALDSLQMPRVLPPFKAQAAYESTPDGRLVGVSHTEYTYLVDDRGRILLAYEFASDPALIARGVKQLLDAGRVQTR